MKRVITLLIVVLVALTSVFASGQKDTPAAAPVSSAPKAGGTLVIASITDPSVVNLYELRGPVLVLDTLWESLMVMDETGTPQPFLAKSVVGDPANLTYTITLNEGILFHDGSELTGEVCKWNIEMYKEHGVLSSSFLGKVESIDVPDKYTCVVHLSEWDPFLPNNMARSNGCGYMTSKLAYDTYGWDYLITHPVSTAPFSFVSYTKDDKIELVKFKDYWRGEPLLDAVTLDFYSEMVVAQAALEKGDAHILFGTATDQNTYLEAQGYKVVKTAIPSNCYSICMDTTDESDPLYNLKVRQAVAYAINNEEISEAIFGNDAIPSNQYSWPGEATYNSDVPWEYNPEKAKQLLAEAGIPDGFSTVLHSIAYPPYAEISQMVQEDLAKVGIKVEIDNTDGAGYAANINGWGKGLFIHPMSLANGVPAQLAANFRQGLKSGIGLTTLTRTDEMNDLVLQGLNQSGAEMTETFKKLQGIIFGDLCQIRAITCYCATSVVSPVLMDSSFGTISTSKDNTLYKTWLNK